MNISTIALLLHVGTLVKDVKDVEQLVADLFAKKPVGEDLKKVLNDLSGLFTAGLAPLPPGMTATQMTEAFSSLLAAI